MQHLLNSSESVDQNKQQNLPRQMQVDVFVLHYIAYVNLDKTDTKYFNNLPCTITNPPLSMPCNNSVNMVLNLFVEVPGSFS